MNDSHIFPFALLSDSELRRDFIPTLLPFDDYSQRKFMLTSQSCSYDQDTDPDYNIVNHRIDSYYYHEGEISFTGNQSPYVIKILHSNIRSIGANLDSFLEAHGELSVLALCETWLSPYSEYLYNLPNFNCYFESRCQKGGGGVALFVSNKYSNSKIAEISYVLPWIETVFVRVNFGGSTNYVIGSIYRPPSCDVSLFIDSMYSIMNVLATKYNNEKVVLTGDTNLDLLKVCENKLTSEYCMMMNSYGFLPYIVRPTRVSCHSATILDQIWYNDDNVVRSGIILSDITDHFPVFIELNIEPSNINVINFSRRILNSRNKAAFDELVSAFDWSTVITDSDPESSYDTFHNKLSEFYEICFPIQNVRRKYLNIKKPYITGEIKKLIQERRKMQRKYFKKPITFRDEYISIRNRVNRLISEAKKSYYRKKIFQSQREVKNLWYILREVTGVQPKSENIKEISVNNVMVRNDFEISNAMNEYFSTVGDKLASKFQDVDVAAPLQYLSYASRNFKFSEVSVEKLHKTVNELNNSHSTTMLDIVPICVYKEYWSALGPAITKICNLCLRRGIFPNKLKTAKIICIHKGGAHDIISNYRPISILPAFAKIIEKVAAHQLYDFFEQNVLLTKSQYGFRKGMSTESAVCTLYDTIVSNIDSGKFTLSVFLDLAKAFDSIDRDILLKKLECYGVRGSALLFLKSYFSDRFQYTNISFTNSNILPVKYGIVQGSTLGPLMFLVYINDIVKSSNLLNFTLYADDTSVCLSGSDLNNLIEAMNRELLFVSNWFYANKLTLNANKSQFVVFHSRQRRVPSDVNNVMVNDSIVNRVSNVKFLGVHFDENLTWKTHLASVCKKLYMFLPLIKKTKNIFDIATFRLLYNALVYPSLIYCVTVWGNASNTCLYNVVTIQKQILRLMFGADRRAHSAGFFKEMNILPMSEIYYYMSLIFVFKSLHGLGGVVDMFEIYEGSYNTRLNSQGSIRIPFARTSLYKNSVRIDAAVKWNSLSRNLRELDNYNNFKINVKQYFMNRMP